MHLRGALRRRGGAGARALFAIGVEGSSLRVSGV